MRPVNARGTAGISPCGSSNQISPSHISKGVSVNEINTRERIVTLKQQHQAVILAHNYQPPEIQDLADIVGDSLELSRKAAATHARVIVFCGVRFMAETASILSPDKTVLMPELSAGCPMADMIRAEQLRSLKKKHAEACVISYVNSTAETKAESDYCCTSGNAEKIVRFAAGQGRSIIFVPDRNLGTYISTMTDMEMVLWDGYCPVHAAITADDILKLKELYPAAKVMVHPECTPMVTGCADAVLSTGGMLTWPSRENAPQYIVGTEVGMLYRLRKSYPDKTFIGASDKAVCRDMKKITPASIAAALENLQPEIRVQDDIRTRALKPLERMLDIR